MAPSSRRSSPSFPSAVREVTELAGVLDDMLPRLPPWVIQVGEEWRSGDSLAIRRLSDSASLQRYRIQLNREGTRATAARGHTDADLLPHAQRSRRRCLGPDTGPHAL